LNSFYILCDAKEEGNRNFLINEFKSWHIDFFWNSFFSFLIKNPWSGPFKRKLFRVTVWRNGQKHLKLRTTIETRKEPEEKQKNPWKKMFRRSYTRTIQPSHSQQQQLDQHLHLSIYLFAFVIAFHLE
jgi:hypothetical protein